MQNVVYVTPGTTVIVRPAVAEADVQPAVDKAPAPASKVHPLAWLCPSKPGKENANTSKKRGSSKIPLARVFCKGFEGKYGVFYTWVNSEGVQRFYVKRLTQKSQYREIDMSKYADMYEKGLEDLTLIQD